MCPAPSIEGTAHLKDTGFKDGLHEVAGRGFKDWPAPWRAMLARVDSTVKMAPSDTMNVDEAAPATSPEPSFAGPSHATINNPPAPSSVAPHAAPIAGPSNVTAALRHPAEDATDDTQTSADDISAFLHAVHPQLASPENVRKFVDAGVRNRESLTTMAGLSHGEQLAMLREDLRLAPLEARLVRAALKEFAGQV